MKTLDEALKEVCVIGAGGKMGRGIALLLLQEMALLEAKQLGKVGTGAYKLILIDSNDQGFLDLRSYLKIHLTKHAEKSINLLREYYAKDQTLVSNEQIIQAFVEGGMNLVWSDTNLEKAKGVHLVFEAVFEDLKTKVNLLDTMSAVCAPDTYYFTNTSSIPISVLEEKTKLTGRLIGFHFYNPPHIQRLVEIIFSAKSSPELKDFAEQLGKRLKKITVVSADVAGFIGNGHFMREISFAGKQVAELSQSYPLVEALYMENRVTQDFLLRPMGIFQLMDYVGLDVCQKIARVMSEYIPDEIFHTELIDSMLAEGIRGGQEPSGAQKSGFFHYEKNVPIAIYCMIEKQYRSLKENGWAEKCDQQLGKLPETYVPWKKLVNDPAKEAKIKTYLHQLKEEQSLGAELAKAFLQHSSAIAEKLVNDGIAKTMDDIDRVVENGFYHLYGPEKGYRGLS